MNTPDLELLRRYAVNDSETAFETLVARHIDLVYSAALRQVKDPHLAEDISQAVFIILAQKAKQISDKTILAGWLYRTTRYTAANALKTRAHRLARENEVYMQTAIETETDDGSAWEELAPRLDELLVKLNALDRDALILRFFQNKSLQEVGQILGLKERAAQKRVSRSLEKLRGLLLARGVALSATAIIGALSVHGIQAAPLTLASGVSSAAIAHTALSPSVASVLAQNVMRMMAWSRLKYALFLAVPSLLFLGTAAVVTEKYLADRPPFAWETEREDEAMIRNLSPQVRITPTIFAGMKDPWLDSDPGQLNGRDQSIRHILGVAYNDVMPVRMIIDTKLPEGRYDFISNLPQDSYAALQTQLIKQFHLSAHREKIATNVLVLSIDHPGAKNLHLIESQQQLASWGPEKFFSLNRSLSPLQNFLEEYLGTPVVDHTGLGTNYSVLLEFKGFGWPHPTDVEKFKAELSSQLGLRLDPGHETIEMLVIQSSQE